MQANWTRCLLRLAPRERDLPAALTLVRRARPQSLPLPPRVLRLRVLRTKLVRRPGMMARPSQAAGTRKARTLTPIDQWVHPRRAPFQGPQHLAIKIISVLTHRRHRTIS